MTTTTTRAPWITVPTLASIPMKVRIVLIWVRTNAAAMGPSKPPRPPVRLTPPTTTAATLFRV